MEKGKKEKKEIVWMTGNHHHPIQAPSYRLDHSWFSVQKQPLP